MTTHQTLKRTLFNTAKLTLAASTILVIGWAFLTVNPNPVEPIKEAEADIFALDFGQKDKRERFVEALVDSGMEKPRSYDWNGNTFYFSMMQTKQPPMEVLRVMQDKFLEHGVNKQAYHFPTPSPAQAGNVDNLTNLSPKERERSAKIYKQSLERLDDFFTGGVVPTHFSSDYISMTGAAPKEDADDALEFLANHIKSQKGLDDSIKAMRFVDARLNRSTGMTTVTATWSDDNLDVKKLTNKSETSSLNVDPNIPSCMGCERRMRFAGEQDESQYIDHVFEGQGSVDQVAGFYDQALRSRGWVPSESSYALEKFMRRGVTANKDPALVRSYARGREFITLLAYPNSAKERTMVHLLESP